MAKSLLQNMDKPPPKTEVESDSWSLQIDGIPVIQDIDKKYMIMFIHQ
jgi:hypothetical protein